ncbi:hypothetical protein LN042_18785 [Kitasatospora sp. RB6PN24]|uniref:hypothetical protein n=1 Tax=Kitasatospora humi TaxID=2893891 RepID=UPI001E5EFBE5|nr:hypothetical protein [Kitasatospora humi]MCC9309103.1 hypothetical protein [Kitasatospora humi]
MAARKPSAKLAAAANALSEALAEIEAAGLSPAEVLSALREPLAVVDVAATKMREMRREAVVGLYPDRTYQVYEIATLANLEPALISRYAKEAGLELRNRRLKDAPGTP